VGIGYLKPEFDALGIPFEDKGPRTIEYLHAMKAIWSQPAPAYRGKLFSFGGVQAFPRPVQQPHPPIVFGGMTPFAFRRSVQHGNGWYGFALDLEMTQLCLAGLREAAERTARPSELGALEISVTPSVPLDRDTVRRFADLGVHRLIPVPRRPEEQQLFSPTLTAADVLDFVERTRELIGAA
jgi:alkanesulfonate monooxygenase SsuD/methylene tetrahydromethanopterin reductase-like flavin-dependent oxidoreductase (luciferase family)